MIYLLGATGYVGHAFQALLRAKSLPHRCISRAELDYTRPEKLARALKDDKVSFLINAAGYTGKPNVDACELHKEDCLLGNAVLPGLIAQACEEAKVPWGHVSSGCIYSGCRPDGTGFREEDEPNFSFRNGPCSFYSGTKALGEEVLAGHPDLYVWRLRIPFDNIDNPRNYLTKLMRYSRLLSARNSISELHEFCAACLSCHELGAPFGTYNVTNPGFVTTEEVVEAIRRSGVCDKAFSFFDSEEEFMHTAAKTPRSNCILDGTKLAAAGIHLTEVHEAVERALRNWRRAG